MGRDPAQHQGANPFGNSELAPGAPVCLGSDFPLRLELILESAAPAAGVDPFVILSDEPNHGRVYLGRLLAGRQNELKRVAIKLQPRGGESSGLEGRTLSDLERRDRWEREWRHYAALAGSGAVSPVLFVEPGHARAGAVEARPYPWPPLIFCRPVGRLIRPRGRGGAPLSVCRDDHALATRGLPPYGGLYRFLWDPEALVAGEEPVFYQVAGGDEEDILTGAVPLQQCFEEMAELLADPLSQIDPASPAGLGRLAELAAEIPGLGQPELREKLAGHPADLFTPWLLEDGWALVIELNALHFDEFCDLLGGCDEKTFREIHEGPASAVGHRLRLEKGLKSELFSKRQLFDDNASGLDALEIFRLKWTLIAQTCLNTMNFYRRCGSPHLRLSPRHVMVSLDVGGAYLPQLWRFQTRLLSLSSPVLALERADPGPEIFVPPSGGDPLYQSEVMRNSTFGVAQRGDFLLSGIEQSEDRFVLKGQLHHDGIGLRWLSPLDHVMIGLGRHLVADAEIELLATRDAAVEYSPRTIHWRSLPIALDPARKKALEKLRGIRVPNAQFRLLPMLHLPSDLYSLGMLLYRALIVNDGQGLGDVALALDSLRQDLASLAAIECEPGGEGYLWDALLAGHRDPAIREVFDRRQVFFGQFDRDEERPNAIPTALWNEAMAFGLQLVTQFEEFSFCAHHGDFDPASPAARLEAVVRRVEDIERKIDAALFAVTARNAEVRQALDMVGQEALMR